jgi:hypothetical protein
MRRGPAKAGFQDGFFGRFPPAKAGGRREIAGGTQENKRGMRQRERREVQQRFKSEQKNPRRQQLAARV